MKNHSIKEGKTVVYQAKDGAIELRGDAVNETIWATQAEMAKVFGVNPQAVTKHIKNIYTEGELSRTATCSKLEQVRKEGNRSVKRTLEIYNLEMLIAVGYRINSVVGTKFRQWATKTLREYILDGYAINRSRVKVNYERFLKAVEDVKGLLPGGGEAKLDADSVLELISLFADTWLSLEAYDKDRLAVRGATKKKVVLTGEKLARALAVLKDALADKGEASELFGAERESGSVAGIVGNVMQSFAGKDVYPSVEEKAAHLLYFMVKDHPFVDGNKRNGAYAFVWFLRQARLLDASRLTPPALTALTLLIAESRPRDKDRMIGLVCGFLAGK